MASCEIIDFRCIFINEIVGSTILAIVVLMILYFIAASRLKLGFDTTIFLLFPTLVIFSLVSTSVSIIFAFISIAAAFMIGWIINKQLGN